MSKRSIFAKMLLGSSICLLVAACGSATITCTATVSTESRAKSIMPNQGIQSSLSSLAPSDTLASIVNISGTLEASAASKLIAQAAGKLNVASVPNVSTFEMDVSGSSVVWPQSGNVTLTITNNNTGAIISARSFGWIRRGSRIQLASPAEINIWVASTGATVDTSKVKYDMGNIEVGSTAGDNVVSAAILQDNIVRSRGLTQWYIDETWHDCGGGRICAPK